MRPIRWSCSTISTKPASAATSKIRRRKTGTVPSRCSPSSFPSSLVRRDPYRMISPFCAGASCSSPTASGGYGSLRSQGRRRDSLLNSDRGQILKPVLRLHELLHLRRQRVGVGVVHHPDQRGVVDDQRRRLRQYLVLLPGIEGLLDLVA